MPAALDCQDLAQHDGQPEQHCRVVQLFRQIQQIQFLLVSARHGAATLWLNRSHLPHAWHLAKEA
jgi:hypothetical protein